MPLWEQQFSLDGILIGDYRTKKSLKSRPQLIGIKWIMENSRYPFLESSDLLQMSVSGCIAANFGVGQCIRGASPMCDKADRIPVDRGKLCSFFRWKMLFGLFLQLGRGRDL